MSLTEHWRGRGERGRGGRGEEGGGRGEGKSGERGEGERSITVTVLRKLDVSAVIKCTLHKYLLHNDGVCH